MSAREISTLDLTLEEQDHVRRALWSLHARVTTWKNVGRVLKFEETTVINCANGKRTVSASMAFRVARFVKVAIDDLLAGKWPEPGTCARCGYKDSRDANGSPAHR